MLTPLQTAAARGVIILKTQENNFLQMESDLRGSLKPSTGIQTLLFEEICGCWWNLRRCQIAEAQLFGLQTDQTLDPLLDDTNEPAYRRIRQLQRVTRLALDKALNRLASIQTEVRYRLQTFPPSAGTPINEQLPHKLSVLCRTEKVLQGALKTGKTAIAKTVRLSVLLREMFGTPVPQPPTQKIDNPSDPQNVSAGHF